MGQVFYILLGLMAGVFSGLFGIGGVTILVPAMVYLAKVNQHQAQGTALAALLPPVGILAVLQYWQRGNVKVPQAAFICAGFFIGGLLGAYFAQGIPSPLLRKLFGWFLLLISLKMIMGK
jgi:uncharacterized membrane protein YfcA